jgi:tetratricopeptide (TPR) repeat protein
VTPGARAARRLLLAAAALWPLAGGAAEVGATVEEAELPALGGGTVSLLGRGAAASVVVLFRPDQENSVDALRQLAGCVREFAGKPVHWVAVVSAAWPEEQVRSAARAAGFRMPIAVDRGDEIYARMGARLHPVIAVVGKDRRLAAWEPYRRLNHCERVAARLRFLLGEISQAELDRVLSPPQATMPGAEASAVARRDVNLGRRQLQQGIAEKALESARKALARDRGLAAAHALLGQALAALGRCPEALPSFAEALRLDPAEAAALEGQRACAAAAPGR